MGIFWGLLKFQIFFGGRLLEIPDFFFFFFFFFLGGGGGGPNRGSEPTYEEKVIVDLHPHPHPGLYQGLVNQLGLYLIYLIYHCRHLIRPIGLF